MKVRIVQMLCPSRHCLVALAYESADGRNNPVMPYHLGEKFVEQKLEHKCAICGATTFTLEDAPTIFSSMAEAEPHLRREETKQAITRGLITLLKPESN